MTKDTSIGMAMKEINVFSLMSRYRSELMGIAILGVLVGHFISLTGISHEIIWVKLLGIVPRLAFTQGFLLLSGLGLYYSFTHNGDIRQFYVRRIKRLVIPFFLLSAWYFIYTDFIADFSPVLFIGHVSSIAYWFVGNYCGMWYIAISFVMYALFPFMYKLLVNSNLNRLGGGGGKICLLLLLAAAIMIDLGLRYMQPKYYEMVSIGIRQIPAFVFGIYAGYLSLQGKSRDSWILVAACIAAYIICLIIDYKAMKGILEKIICMSVISLMLYKSDRLRPVSVLRSILSWLGKYSLELYLLHLFIYCFLGKEELFGEVNIYLRCALMIVISLAICAPSHKAVDVIVNRIIFKHK